MAIKKKQTLRSKAASRQNRISADSRTSLSKYQKQSSALSTESNPFLHALKITKKERQSDKSNDFLQKLNMKTSSINTSSNISKSAIRRRKRKEKAQLGANLGDLLTTLPEHAVGGDATLASSSNPFSAPSKQISTERKPLNHAPNPRASLKGARKVEQMERARFGLILTDKNYQNSPFEALRDTIKANMDNLR